MRSIETEIQFLFSRKSSIDLLSTMDTLTPRSRRSSVVQPGKKLADLLEPQAEDTKLFMSGDSHDDSV